MSEILLLLTGAILVNHLVLTRFAGVGPSGGPYGKLEIALATALAMTLTMTIASIGFHVLYQYLLLPFQLAFLRTVTIVLVIVTAASALTLLSARFFPRSFYCSTAAPRLPATMLVGNCVILSMPLIGDEGPAALGDSLLRGAGTALCVSAVLVLFAAMQERLNMRDVPAPFRGSAIALISVGLVSLALMGFAGLV